MPRSDYLVTQSELQATRHALRRALVLPPAVAPETNQHRQIYCGGESEDQCVGEAHMRLFYENTEAKCGKCPAVTEDL